MSALHALCVVGRQAGPGLHWHRYSYQRKETNEYLGRLHSNIGSNRVGRSLSVPGLWVFDSKRRRPAFITTWMRPLETIQSHPVLGTKPAGSSLVRPSQSAPRRKMARANHFGHSCQENCRTCAGGHLESRLTGRHTICVFIFYVPRLKTLQVDGRGRFAYSQSLCMATTLLTPFSRTWWSAFPKATAV